MNKLYTIKLQDDTREDDVKTLHGMFDDIYRRLGTREKVHSLPATIWEKSSGANFGSNGITPVWQFKKPNIQSIITSFKIGDSMDIQKVKPVLRAHYSVSSGGSGDIYHRLEAHYISANNLLNDTPDETLNKIKPVGISAGQIEYVDFVLDKSKIKKGDLISLQYSRIGNDTYDTFNQDSYFVLGEFIYYDIGRT